MTKEQIEELKNEHTEMRLNPKTKQQEAVFVSNLEFFRKVHGLNKKVLEPFTEFQEAMATQKRDEKEGNEIVQAYLYFNNQKQRIIVSTPLRLLELVKKEAKEKKLKGYRELN